MISPEVNRGHRSTTRKHGDIFIKISTAASGTKQVHWAVLIAFQLCDKNSTLMFHPWVLWQFLLFSSSWYRHAAPYRTTISMCLQLTTNRVLHIRLSDKVFLESTVDSTKILYRFRLINRCLRDENETRSLRQRSSEYSEQHITDHSFNCLNYFRPKTTSNDLAPFHFCRS